MIFRVRRFVQSLRYAFLGLKYTFVHEQNFRIHVLAALCVLWVALLLHVKAWEAIVLVLVITFVLVLEIVNTIFEKLMDLIKPRLHHYVGVIKDLMAAAVLISALGSVVIGLFIFLPYLYAFFQ